MNHQWINEACAIIASGGVVALPYERLYGLAADALNPQAVARVAAIKNRSLGRPDRRPIAVILPNVESLEHVAAEVTSLAGELAHRHWPGLLTMVIPARVDLPPELVSEQGLIGVRLSGPCPAATLAQRSGRILTATSANLSGAPDALSDADVRGLPGIDLIVPGEVAGPPGSTVVDVSGDSPRVLRQGAVYLKEH